MESKENRSAQPRICREAKKWGLKALLTAALPTAKGAQPTVASWPEFQVEAELQEVTSELQEVTSEHPSPPPRRGWREVRDRVRQTGTNWIF